MIDPIVCQMYDTQVRAGHGPIFVARTIGEAERMFEHIVKNDPLVRDYTHQFILRGLGSQDHEGKLTALEPYEIVVGEQWVKHNAETPQQARDRLNQVDLVNGTGADISQISPGELEKLRQMVSEAERSTQ